VGARCRDGMGDPRMFFMLKGVSFILKIFLFSSHHFFILVFLGIEIKVKKGGCILLRNEPPLI